MPQLHKTASSSQGCKGTQRGVEQERVAEPWRLSIVYVIAIKVFNEVSTGGQMKTSAHGSSGRLSKPDQAEAMSRMYVHQVSFAIRPPLSAVRPASCRVDEIAARQSRHRADVFVGRLKPSRALDCLPTCTDESTARIPSRARVPCVHGPSQNTLSRVSRSTIVPPLTRVWYLAGQPIVRNR